MADPTSTTDRSYKQDVSRTDDLIKTSEALVIGGFAAIDIDTGEVEFADDANDLHGIGVVLGSADGDNDNLTGDGSVNKAVVRGGVIIEDLTVTGASARSDVFKKVYATDGQTLTLTKPTAGRAVGFVYNHVSSTTCDVYFFDKRDAFILGVIGGQVREIELLAISSRELEGTSAIDLLTSLPMNFHGKITSFFAVVESADSGVVAGSQILNLEIGTTDVTGGLLTLATGNVQGAIVSATAITAANEFKPGDTISVEMAASGTGFTAAKNRRYSLRITVEPMV